MRRKIFLLIVVTLLFLTGCKSKDDKLFQEQENLVKEELSNTNNITEEKIRDKYLYLKDNYESYNKKNKKEYIYSAKYIQTIGNKTQNDLTRLADLMLIYIKDSSKDNYERLDVMFKNVEHQENKLINDLYNNYLIDNIVETTIKKKQEQVAIDLKDKKLLTSKYLKTGVNYIQKNLANPFKNNEVLENLVYYSLYFDGLKTKGSIKSLGNKTLNYLRTLDSNQYAEIEQLLSKMNKDKEIKKVLKK